MLTDLNTSVTTISPEQLDELFKDTPDSTATADDLKLGKVESTVTPSNSSELPMVDLDELDKQAEETTETKDDKKEEVKVEDKKDTEEKKDEKVADATASKDKKAEDETKIDPSLLKSNVEYLVKKGIFKDFEGREELEMTEEVYGQLLEAQVNKIVEDRYTAKKSAAGDYGQAIIDFVEKGGDPDLIIDLFKEKKEIEQFDISTEDAQKELISRYYKEVLRRKPDAIKRQMDFLATQEDAIKNEAAEIKEKYEEHFNSQQKQLKAQQDAYEQEQLRRQKVFESSIKDAIKTYDTDQTRQQRLEANLFKFKELEDGTKVNEFYLKFAEWQSDPKKYIELVDFITDHDNYIKRKEIEAQNKAVDKTFKFVKGNQAISKNTGSGHEEVEKESKKQTGTNFSVVFK